MSSARRIPPESVATGSVDVPWSPKSSSNSPRAFGDNLRGQVVQQAGKSQIFRNGKRAIQRRLLEDNPDCLARPHRLRPTSKPATSAAACGGTDERGEHVDRGGLAGTVRTEQAEKLPGLDLQIETVDSERFAVALCQPARARIAGADHAGGTICDCPQEVAEFASSRKKSGRPDSSRSAEISRARSIVRSRQLWYGDMSQTGSASSHRRSSGRPGSGSRRVVVFLRAGAARLLHPAVAAVRIEAGRVVPDPAQVVDRARSGRSVPAACAPRGRAARRRRRRRPGKRCPSRSCRAWAGSRSSRARRRRSASDCPRAARNALVASSARCSCSRLGSSWSRLRTPSRSTACWRARRTRRRTARPCRGSVDVVDVEPVQHDVQHHRVAVLLDESRRLSASARRCACWKGSRSSRAWSPGTTAGCGRARLP